MAKAHKKFQVLNTYKELTRAEKIECATQIVIGLYPMSRTEEETMFKAIEDHVHTLEKEAQPWDGEDTGDEDTGDEDTGDPPDSGNGEPQNEAEPETKPDGSQPPPAGA